MWPDDPADPLDRFAPVMRCGWCGELLDEEANDFAVGLATCGRCAHRYLEPRWPESDILVGVSRRATRDRIDALIADLGRHPIPVSDGHGLAERIADGVLDRRARPVAIITDSVLPGCSGTALLATLHDLEWDDVPVVFVIDPHNKLARRRAWDAEVAGVFMEPFRDRDLRMFIELILDPRVRDALPAARARRIRNRA